MSVSEAYATILVKCPAVLNTMTEDFLTKISLRQTVGELKRALQESHPCKPEKTDQRLIFRGQILDDDTSIGNLCQKQKATELVIHMVLKSGKYYGRADETLKSQTDGISPSMKSISTSPIRPNGPAYYGIVNDQGQVVYTDISNAVLFDGRQFYVMRGTTMPSISGSIMPFSVSTAVSHSSSPRRARFDQRPAINERRIVHRINIDLAVIFSFLLRFGIVILVFSQGGGTMKIAFLCALFGAIFLVQAGMLDFLGFRGIVRRIWDPIMRVRQMPVEAGDGEEGRVRVRPNPNINHLLGNPVFKIFEVITTFWLSLFPAEPPQLPNAVQ